MTLANPGRPGKPLALPGVGCSDLIGGVSTSSRISSQTNLNALWRAARPRHSTRQSEHKSQCQARLNIGDASGKKKTSHQTSSTTESVHRLSVKLRHRRRNSRNNEHAL